MQSAFSFVTFTTRLGVQSSVFCYLNLFFSLGFPKIAWNDPRLPKIAWNRLKRAQANYLKVPENCLKLPEKGSLTPSQWLAKIVSPNSAQQEGIPPDRKTLLTCDNSKMMICHLKFVFTAELRRKNSQGIYLFGIFCYQGLIYRCASELRRKNSQGIFVFSVICYRG